MHDEKSYVTFLPAFDFCRQFYWQAASNIIKYFGEYDGCNGLTFVSIFIFIDNWTSATAPKGCRLWHRPAPTAAKNYIFGTLRRSAPPAVWAFLILIGRPDWRRTTATRKKPSACLTAPLAVWRIPCGAPSCALLAWCWPFCRLWVSFYLGPISKALAPALCWVFSLLTVASRWLTFSRRFLAM